MDEFLESLELIDHHCHGLTRESSIALEFEQRLTEARHPMPFEQRYVDTPLGFAFLTLCSPVLDLGPQTCMQEYLERREALGHREVARRFLADSNLSGLIVDTGYACEETSPADLGELAGCPSYIVHRVEAIAEDILRERPRGAIFAEELDARLRDAARTGVGFKSIVAYRGGLEIVNGAPSASEVNLACSQVMNGRLTNPVLIRHVLYQALTVAADVGLPIQFHVGYGDSDLDFRSANPLHLDPFIREALNLQVPVVLLHCYPYHREAGLLASVFPNVFFDIGLAIPHVGFDGDRILAEAMEVAPFAKLLYSSDAAHLPEFFYLASRLFRKAAASVFSGWVARGSLTEEDASRVATMIGSENARRVYSTMRQPVS